MESRSTHPSHQDTIVVGIDGSPASLRAFDWAVAEAGRRAAELVAVHVLDAPSVPLDVVAEGARTPCYSTAVLEEAATRHLAGLVTRGREGPGVRRPAGHRVGGQAVPAAVVCPGGRAAC